MIMRFHLYHFLRNVLLVGWILQAGTLHARESTASQGAAEAAIASVTQPYKVLVLGDSISAAYGMSLEQGWVALLEKSLAEEFPGLTLINTSISGETTAGGLARLPALLEAHNPTLVIIELGGNDGLRGYPINNVRENLRQLVLLSQQSGAQVLLLPMEIPPNYGSRYTKAFRQSFTQVAEETHSHLGAFILEEIALEQGLMQADGIHPTAQAQPQIAAAIETSLRDLMRAE